MFRAAIVKEKQGRRSNAALICATDGPTRPVQKVAGREEKQEEDS
jgi:hypothetical protein